MKLTMLLADTAKGLAVAAAAEAAMVPTLGIPADKATAIAGIITALSALVSAVTQLVGPSVAAALVKKVEPVPPPPVPTTLTKKTAPKKAAAKTK